jgi:hypothetical protein
VTSGAHFVQSRPIRALRHWWLVASGATYIGATTFLLAHRRLGFPWWPLALLAASLVAYGLVDIQDPCFPDG